MKYLAQVFQAIRIEVNEEMEALKEFLTQAGEILKQEGTTGGVELPFFGRSVSEELYK